MDMMRNNTIQTKHVSTRPQPKIHRLIDARGRVLKVNEKAGTLVTASKTGKNSSFNDLFKVFARKVHRSNIINELKEHSAFEKPSDKKRRKAKISLSRALKEEGNLIQGNGRKRKKKKVRLSGLRERTVQEA